MDSGPKVPLEAFVARLGPARIIGEVSGVVVTSVTYDHRRTGPGALHCCLPGDHFDGHDFASVARRAGAVAFVCEHPLGAEAGGAVQLVVGPAGGRRGDGSCRVRPVGRPRLVASDCRGDRHQRQDDDDVLPPLGLRVARLADVGDRDARGPRTTPEAPELQRALAHARDSGHSAVALEVSSHALAQHRLDGYRHDVGVFTNLSQDHLDYHGSMEAYFEAKAQLFTPEHATRAVVNADDPFGRRLVDAGAIPMSVFSLSQAEELEVGLEESHFRLGGEPVRVRPGGEINVRNALAAAAAARELGVPLSAVAAGLSVATGPPGRLEAVPNDIGATIVVDYAHTPQGLEEILRAARLEAEPGGGRVIVVFGCGGERDRGKRPVMGSVATRLADLAVLTSDNPRSEDPIAIIDEVRAGCDGTARLVVEPDRRQAIAVALGSAGAGDVVIVAGKGHETVQQIGDRSIEFDDRVVTTEELERLRAEGAGS